MVFLIVVVLIRFYSKSGFKALFSSTRVKILFVNKFYKNRVKNYIIKETAFTILSWSDINNKGRRLEPWPAKTHLGSLNNSKNLRIGKTTNLKNFFNSLRNHKTRKLSVSLSRSQIRLWLTNFGWCASSISEWKLIQGLGHLI